MLELKSPFSPTFFSRAFFFYFHTRFWLILQSATDRPTSRSRPPSSPSWFANYFFLIVAGRDPRFWCVVVASDTSCRAPTGFNDSLVGHLPWGLWWEGRSLWRLRRLRVLFGCWFSVGRGYNPRELLYVKVIAGRWAVHVWVGIIGGSHVTVYCKVQWSKLSDSGTADVLLKTGFKRPSKRK